MSASTKIKQSEKSPDDGVYAIVEASGQQFWLKNNRYYDLDRIKAEVNEEIVFDKVLLLNNGKEIVSKKSWYLSISN